MPRPPCAYCGDAPVPHAAQYVASTLDILLERFTPSSEPLLVRLLGRFLARLGLMTGIMRASSVLPASVGKRSRVVWEEAVRRGIPIQSITLVGKHVDEYRALLPVSKGSKRRAWHYFQSIPVPPWLERGSSSWVDDKRALKKRFVRAGLTIADGASVMTLHSGLRVFRRINGPVIVKPRSGSRARHTSVNITTERDFIAAFKRAQQLCAFIMVEACIPGDTYRATVVDGTLMGAMHFVKPRIEADGTSTCDELLERYNQKLPKDVHPVKRDGPYKDALDRQGLAPQAVPAAGTLVTLAEHSERANGGYNEDITDRIPPNTRAEIERAARTTGLALIGFDLISRDLTDPSEPFTFIEGNSLPFIDIHHYPTIGTPRDVAGAVLDLWVT